MSQHALAQDRFQDLSSSSLLQPDRSLRRKPVGIQAGLVALVLAALTLSSMLAYAAVSALCLRNGYTEIALKRDIEDLRAHNALLKYQVNLSESNHRVEQVAARFSLRPADPVREVDYVALPAADREEVRLATSDPARLPGGLSGAVAALANDLAAGAGGRAEASTAVNHRP